MNNTILRDLINNEHIDFIDTFLSLEWGDFNGILSDKYIQKDNTDNDRDMYSHMHNYYFIDYIPNADTMLEIFQDELFVVAYKPENHRKLYVYLSDGVYTKVYNMYKDGFTKKRIC